MNSRSRNAVVLAVLAVVLLMTLIISLLFGADLARAALHRNPTPCYFTGEAIWELCRAWLPPAAGASSSTGRPGQSRYIKGIYVSHYALGSPEFVAHVKDLLETTELNAVVMDVKGDRGHLVYPTQVPLAQQIGAGSQVMVRDWPAFMQWFKERNIYTIARIVTFKDNRLSAAYPNWAVRDAATGQVWKDGEGLGWADPMRQEVQDYNIALAVEAARQGFDEIQFDYVRFPSDGAVSRAVFSGPNTATNRIATIAGFLARARAALAPFEVKVSADIFGYTCWVTDDLGIGQVIEAMAPHLDVLSPMIYPSTFATGLPGDGGVYANAIAFPYEIIHKSTFRAVARARTVNPDIEVRPWLQDFADYAFDRRTYTPDEIRAQMAGARDAGGRGWLLWDPAVRYTRAALVSARPSYPPHTNGFVPVLRYREIGRPAGPGVRTPEAFRADLERLLAAGYYPVTLAGMVEGRLNMTPEGKRPVVLTFDGATPGQFRLLADGSVDAESAVGILKAFHDAHPADWPLAAVFFIAPDGDEPGPAVFGQAASARRKLEVLRAWGMEIGSYGMAGEKLSGKSAAEVQRELGTSQALLERWLPGLRVLSLALPDGAAPADKSLLSRGEHDGRYYDYRIVVGVGGGLAPSPRSARFDPYRIPRVEATDAELARWLAIADRPNVAYVSAGE